MKNELDKHLLLFDLDDTLLDTSDLYWKTKDKFINLIEANIQATYQVSYNRNILESKFESIDGKNILSMGFHPNRYRVTMIEMYTELVNKNILDYSKLTEESINDISSDIFQKIPDLIPGAIKMLKILDSQNRYELVLVTRGIEELQRRKLVYHNLSSFFTSQFVVEKKDSELYKNIIDQLGYKPNKTWIIGDSIKSEIIPALAIGAKCILYLYRHHTYHWLQEHTDQQIDHKIPSVSHLEEIPSLLTFNLSQFCA